MSNQEFDAEDRAARTQALDRFSEAGRGDDRPTELMIPAQAFADDGGRIVGAQQVAVYRNITRVLAEVKALGAAAAEGWYYRWPVKGKGEQKFVEGPSIKLANDLARIYGNCDIDVRVRDLGESWLFYARFTDFETGFSMTRPFQQRKSQVSMKTDADRQRDIAFQIGASKAIRNVVTNALQTYTDVALEAAMDSSLDKVAKRLDFYKGKLLDRLNDEKIAIARVERTVARVIAEWRPVEVVRIIAMVKAISDQMTTWDETFPPLEQPAVVDDGRTERAMDDFAQTDQGRDHPDKNAGPAGAEAAGAKSATQPADDRAGSRQAAATATAAPAPKEGTAAAAAPARAGEQKPAGDAKPASVGPTADQQEGRGAETAATPKAEAGTVAAQAAAPADAKPVVRSSARLESDDAKRLMQYSEKLMGAMTSGGLQKASTAFWGVDFPEDEATPLGGAVASVYELHVGRIKGTISISDVEKGVRQMAGGVR